MGLRPKYYFVVRRSPLVLAYAGGASGDVGPDVPRLGRLAPDPVVLEHPSWWQGHPQAMDRAAERQRRLAGQGIEHHLIVSTPEEDDLRRDKGVRGAMCSKNLYCDEPVFVPPPTAPNDDADEGDPAPFAALGVDGKFDAIYIANLEPYKRRELARNVRRLLVVSDGGDLPAICPELTHARYNLRWMPSWAVAACVQQSRCSLVLSALEGQNNATVEYPLCGIPVVSTPSKGGRDLFLDDAGSLLVEPTARAVAEAVATFRTAPPDPGDIRRRVLARIDGHRRVFCRYVVDLLAGRNVGVCADVLLQELFGGAAQRERRFVRRADIESIRARGHLDEPAVVPAVGRRNMPGHRRNEPFAAFRPGREYGAFHSPCHHRHSRLHDLGG